MGAWRDGAVQSGVPVASMIRYALLVALFVALSCRAHARPPLPEYEWTEYNTLLLARSFVGEAGWYAKRDHVAIAYVLARRWKAARQRWPELRFADLLKLYVKALGYGRRSLTPRQTWLRGLHGPDRPLGWPAGASWARKRPFWAEAVRRAQAWMRGQLRDPCRGRAWHWGGTIDIPGAKKKRLRPVDCGATENTFYDRGGQDG